MVLFKLLISQLISETQGFVDKLFEAVGNKSYLPPPEPTSTVTVREDALENPEKEVRREEVFL